MRRRLLRALSTVTGLILLFAALEVLRVELAALTWGALSSAVVGTAPSALAGAVLLTGLNYAVLTAYDFIAVASAGVRLSCRRIAATSFLAYAIANNVGFAMFTGVSVRYRFYGRWGVSARELSRIVFSYTVTFWIGLLAVGGLILATNPSGAAPGLVIPTTLARPAGWVLLALSLGYVAAAGRRRTPLRLRSLELPLPSVRVALLQLAVSSVEWALAGAVLYVLLPPSRASFLTVLGAFLAAQVLSLASHVPGGIGVFEGLMVLLLKPFLGSGQLLPALVVYRAVYYLLPLSVALVALMADQLRLSHSRLRTLLDGAHPGQMVERLLPRVLAALTFLAGVVLLVSGSTPAALGRLAFLNRLFPLGVIETSHIVGSVAGAALLLLSQGLSRRLDAAYLLTVAVVAAGILASLLKGGDYEEAGLLSLLLVALYAARSAFTRRAALFATRFSPAWVAAVVTALAGSAWLVLFAFTHVDYAPDLWWQFALNAQASRALRSSVAAASLGVLFAGARLLRQAPPEIELPGDAEVEAASRIIGAQDATYPYLAYLRDKALLFSAEGDAFLMYGVHGRTWVALGDPVGPAIRVPELIRAFIERCHDFGGTPVFYEVGTEHLHYYADLGLTFVKLGEEAQVDLAGFSLEGGRGAGFRQAVRRLERDGGRFRIIARDDVPAVMSALRTVSEDWLRHKPGAEKGFSMGAFEPDYLSRFPIAVIERNGAIQAFATVWPGANREELSVDLMRYHRDAPKGVMEALFVHMLQWGKTEGYRRFALGMAPMSGLESSPVAPLWTRIGRLLYTHGESIYHFQGLRAYKEKFNPIWESHYLAYPGGLALPRILTDVSALIAGGYRRILTK